MIHFHARVTGGSIIKAYFVSDLHGHKKKYSKLFDLLREETPDILFIGGDILPSASFYFSSAKITPSTFVELYLVKEFKKLREELKTNYPLVMVIPGNDDAAKAAQALASPSYNEYWKYIQMRKYDHNNYSFVGYSYIPPTPFRLKDWEKYDVSRYVDPGCISPEEGMRTVEVDQSKIRFESIKKDMDMIAEGIDFANTIFLFHSPPYNTSLDRANLDNKIIDHVPVDVHVGSIAIRRFIEKYRPLITLHGHVHESTRLTGKWIEKIGNTYCFNAAHDGSELSVIKFTTDNPESAERILI